jgi:hypothetical protein
MYKRPHTRAQNILCLDPGGRSIMRRVLLEIGVFFVVPGISVLFEENYPPFRVFINVSSMTVEK